MSHAIDFLIAAALVCLAFSILVSHAVEWVNGRRRQRSRFLWMGVARWVGSTAAAVEIVDAVKTHALIRGLARQDDDANAASYIPAPVLADALLDVVLRRGAGVRLERYGPAEAIASLPDDLALKTCLRIAWSRAGDDPVLLREAIARQFDDTMDRVEGWYRRDSQVLSFWIGLTIAFLLNIDAVHISAALWQQPAVAAKVAKAAERAAERATTDSATQSREPGASAEPWVSALDGLPIGWPPPWLQDKGQGATGHGPAWHIVGAALGFFLMALAGVAGAPIWFQMLAALLPFRAAGRVPPRTVEPVDLARVDDPMTQPRPAAAASSSGRPKANALEQTLLASGRIHDVRHSLGLAPEGELDDDARSAIRIEQARHGYATTGYLTQLLLRDLEAEGRLAPPP